jgi:hypothetical protein
LACAADVIVTFDKSDFPTQVLDPFGITAVTPDSLACSLHDTRIVQAAAADHHAALRRPPLSVEEYLGALGRNGLPGAAASLSRIGIRPD